MKKTRVYLVESVPWGMDDLRITKGVAYTEDVLIKLVVSAHRTIDIAAMYWSLLAETDTPDCADISPERLQELGTEHGERLYEALEGAAQRGVQIRVLQSPGFLDGPQEADRLADEYPDQVQVHQVDMANWYGGGIMHQKILLADNEAFYLGSANMDWRSLTQVKELGVVVENHAVLAADLARYFETWWHFAAREPKEIRQVWDSVPGIERRVPSWSTLVVGSERVPSPFDRPEWEAMTSLENQAVIVLNGEAGRVFLTGSPPELCTLGRTTDLDGLVATLRDAQRSICVSVMTYSAVSRYRGIGGDDEAERVGACV